MSPSPDVVIIPSYPHSLPSFPVVEPDIAHTKLRVSKEGLDVISRITNPIAVVAVSDKYRTYVSPSRLLEQ